MIARPRTILVIILGLSLLVIFSTSGLAQEAGPGKTPGVETFIGKIIYMKNYGGYVVITEKPHEEYKIINENKEILSQLEKEGKPVKIEGTLPRGAFFLQIDKINGKKYP
jgi:hypothetical protein